MNSDNINIAISPQRVLDHARYHQWTAEQLAHCFPGMTLSEAQILLDVHPHTFIIY